VLNKGDAERVPQTGVENHCITMWIIIPPLIPSFFLCFSTTVELEGHRGGWEVVRLHIKWSRKVKKVKDIKEVEDNRGTLNNKHADTGSMQIHAHTHHTPAETSHTTSLKSSVSFTELFSSLCWLRRKKH